MFDRVASTVSSLVQWAYWIGRDNGPDAATPGSRAGQRARSTRGPAATRLSILAACTAVR